MAKKKNQSLSQALAKTAKGVTKTVANDKSASADQRAQARRDYRTASRIAKGSSTTKSSDPRERTNFINNSRLQRNNSSSQSTSASNNRAGTNTQARMNRIGGESTARRNASSRSISEIAQQSRREGSTAARTYGELQEKAKDKRITDTAVGKELEKIGDTKFGSAMKRMGLTAQGTAKEVYGSARETMAAIRDPNEERMKASDKIREQRGEQVKGNKYEGAYDKLRNQLRDNEEQRTKDMQEASKILDSAQEDKERAKKGLGKIGSTGLDIESAFLGMLGDAAVGAATGTGEVGALTSMAVRSFGGAYDSAKKEGASDSQAALYGASVGGMEVLSEKMFNVGKAFKSVFGSGYGDELIEAAAAKGAEKLASKFTSKGMKDVALHGTNYIASAMTEGLEEVATGVADPFVANAIYARAVGNPHSFDPGQTFSDFIVGAALGGMGGGVSEASKYRQGAQVKNVLGPDGLKDVADRVALADEDSGASDSARAIGQMVLNGEEVANAQALQLYKAAEQQEQKNFNNFKDSMNGAQSIIERDNLLSPSGLQMDESGQFVPTIGDNTNIKFQEARIEAQSQLGALQLKENVPQALGDAVASIQTGIGGVEDVEALIKYPEARAVYEAVTGESLPVSRKAMREYLYKKNAENRVQSAREETDFWKDQAVGLLSQTETEEVGGNGQAAFTSAVESLDVQDLGSNGLTAVRTAFNDYYQSAQLGIPMSVVNDIAKPEYDLVPESVKQQAYNAGILDANGIMQQLDGVAVQRGKDIKEAAKDANKNGTPGKLYIDADDAARKYFTGSQQKMWKALAEEFGVGIHIMDAEAFAAELRSRGQEVSENAEELPNGFYKDGEIYLNAETPDRALRYVFAHELTHHLQQVAPEEYNELRNRMVDELLKDESLEKRIARKQAQYGGNLSATDALDEILADSTYEFLNDDEFINNVAKDRQSLAQAVVDAIRNVLRKIRAMLARDEYTPRQNANMYAQLDVLKDMEALWMDAINVAKENAAATDLIRENGEIQFSIKPGMSEEERYNELKNKTINIVPYNEDLLAKNNADLDALETRYRKAANEILKPLAKKLGVIKKGYKNPSMEIEFNYSNNNLDESTKKQTGIKGDDIFVNFAKMLSCLEDVVNNAELIEVHNDKYVGTPRENTNLKNTYVLVSAYKDNEYIVPVKLVVKELLGIDNVMYVTMAMQKIKEVEVLGQSMPSTKDGENSPRSTFNYSLALLLKEIKNNPDAETLGQYIPNQFATHQNNAGRFSMKDSRETVGGLVALHNLKESDIKGTLELGGFPMPSIAIVKADEGHSDYGEYSAVFNKDTIDPRKAKANKVYGGDAWTPTFPQIQYKVNEDVRKRISDLYYSIYREYGSETAKGLNSYTNELERMLQNGKGEEGMIRDAKDDTRLMQTYLATEGSGKVENVMKRSETRISETEEGLYKFMINELGEDLVREIKPPYTGQAAVDHRVKYVNEHIDEIKAAYKKWLIEEANVSESEVDSMMANTKNLEFLKVVRNALKYLDNGPVTVKEEYDWKATDNAIRDAVKGTGFDKWVEDLFTGAVEKTGIYNGKDIFTNSGNRRSFEQTHWDVNVDNVVKAMKLQENGDTFLGGALKAVAQKIYKNISEIRADSNRLRKENEEEHEKKISEFADREGEIVSNIVEKYNMSTYDNPYTVYGSVRDAIVDCVRRGLSNEAMLKELHEYPYSKGATMEDVEAIVQLVKDVSEMPTTYFEAKPERAVKLDEIKAMLTPDNAPSDLVEAMEAAGINVVKYKAGDDADRVEKLNSVEGVRFSKKDSGGRELSEGQQSYFANSQVRDDQGNLMVLYHGTENAGFNVFDGSNGIASEFFFFTDNPVVAKTYSANSERYVPNYNASVEGANDLLRRNDEDAEVVERDGEYYLIEDGDETFLSDDVTELDTKLEEYYGWGGEGSYNYEVYANLTNPLIIDAEGNNWDEIPMSEDMPEEMINDQSELENSTTTNRIAEWAYENGYDGVIINNVYDSGIYATTSERFTPATDVIAFSPEQIKDVDNTNPTESEDIRFSQKEIEALAASKGYTEHVYHGAPEGGFTVFDNAYDNGFNWFTEAREYAEVYEDKLSDMEDMDSWESQGVPQMYEGYLNIDGKMLDITSVDIEDALDPAAINKLADTLNVPVNVVEDMAVSLHLYDADDSMFYHDVWELTASKEWAELLRSKGYIGQKALEGKYYTGTDDRFVTYGMLDSNRFKTGEEITRDDQGNEISTENRFDINNPDIRYSQKDAEYMAAVEAGDMEKAQQMVRAAAEDAGYVIAAYHGTQEQFNEFDEKAINSGDGFWFSDEYETSHQYGSVRDMALDLGNSKFIDANYAAWDEIIVGDPSEVVVEIVPEMEDGRVVSIEVSYADGGSEEYEINIDPEDYEAQAAWVEENIGHMDEVGINEVADILFQEGSDIYSGDLYNEYDYGRWDLVSSTNELTSQAKDEGYDSLEIANVEDGGSDENTDYIIFKPNLIKSLDPVTYDDDGNIIPLSQRFQHTSNDVRYSQKETEIDEDAVYDYMAAHPEIYEAMWTATEVDRNYVEHKQNTAAELRVMVERLKRNQKKTYGLELDESSVRSSMNELVKTLLQASELGRGVKKTDNRMVNDCVANAKSMFTAYKRGDIDSMTLTAINAAESMVDSLRFIDDSLYEYYQDLRDYFKAVPIMVDDTIKSDIPDYAAWKKSQWGKLRIAKDGVPVDVMYEELCGMFPEMFDRDISNPTDQLLRMGEAMEDIQPYAVYLSSEEYDNLVRQTAGDLIDITVKGRTYRSMADRYEERLKAAKQRAKEAERDAKAKGREAVKVEREKGNQRVAEEKQKRKDSEARLRADRDAKVQAEKDKRSAADQKRKEAAQRRKSMKRLNEDYKWLSDRILKPTDDKHVPDRMVKPLAELLQYIDLETEYSKKFEAKTGQPTMAAVNLRDLRAALEDVSKSAEARWILEDEDLIQMIEELQTRIGDAPIYELDNSELDAVQALLHAIKVDVANANKAFVMDRAIDDTAKSVIWEANEYKANSKNRRDGGLYHKIIDESMVKPMEFFERLGPAMKSTYMAMRKGMDTQSNHMKEARKFFAEVFEGYGKKGKPGSTVQSWRGKKEEKEFTLESGERITLNPSQVMSLYCLSKREQALGHILGQGICASDPTEFTRIQSAIGTKEQHKQSTTMVTANDIKTIINSLSDEQIRMADKLQNYLNTTVAEWGNETSLLMYDRRKFTEENYFPIQSQDVYLDANFEKRNNNVESIKNFGFTKGTVVNANNPIVINDIFAVCAKHINQMMLYNAYAPAISDFTRVYNYRDVQDNHVEAVQAILADTYGGKIVDQYISKFMADLQNNTQTRRGGFERLANGLLANYKKAAIAASPRVALQQPTAIVRALSEIDLKYFAKMDHSPQLLQMATGQDNAYKEMMEHCPTAYWKSMGFNQVDMARDIEDIMMNMEWSRLDTLTMGVYGALDNYTWSKIWKAIKAEQKDKHPEVEYESDEFWELCNDRAIEVFDKTQVVDSVFHRSDVMRNKELYIKSITSFMAEPTTTFNMLRSNLMRANDLAAQGKHKEAWQLRAKTVEVYTANAMLCAMAAAIADAILKKDAGGDDDDKENKTFFDFWLANTIENFKGNENPLNMIPFAKDFSSYAEGWGASNMIQDGIAAMIKDGKAILDKATDPESKAAKKNWTELITQFAKDSSSVTGIPIKNILRYGAAACDILGINVHATEKGGDEDQKNIFGQVLSLTGFADKKSESEGSASDEPKYKESWLTGKLHEAGVTEGTTMDKVLDHFGLNKTVEEQEQEAYDQKLKEVLEAGEGYEGVDRDEKLYSKATYGYTKLVQEGNFEELENIRKILNDCDVDTAKFDKGIEAALKKGIKRQIGEKGDEALRNKLTNYLKETYGYSDEEFSREVLEKTDTAKEFQKLLCKDDYDGAVQQLRYLREAGLTYEDFVWLYEKRWSQVEAETTGTFAWPGSGRVSSGFGHRWGTLHAGMDIAMPVGSEVTASDGGEVVFVGYDSARGKYVDIKHDNGYVSRYQHLSWYDVEKGQKVAKGQYIAKSGNTGSSTGPHLHFAVYQSTSHTGCTHGTAVDPSKFLASNN